MNLEIPTVDRPYLGSSGWRENSREPADTHALVRNAYREMGQPEPDQHTLAQWHALISRPDVTGHGLVVNGTHRYWFDRVQLETCKHERDALASENLKMAAERVFIMGGDIPETIERTRLVLVDRANKAEASLATARRLLTLEYQQLQYDRRKGDGRVVTDLERERGSRIPFEDLITFGRP